MKVRELIAELSKWAPDTEVILQKDGEGNRYSPLYCVDGNAVYVAESTWSGEVYSTDNSADDNCMDEAEWAKLLEGPRCVVLAPVN
jgi:hypothetical protein